MSAEAGVTAALLRQGRLLDQLSSGLSLLAAGGLLFGGAWLSASSGWLCATILLGGLVQKYYALRAGFDAELFAALDGMSLPELDQTLASLGLRPASAETRGLAERCRGALRLLRRQLLWLLAQVVLLVIVGGQWLLAG